MRTDPDPSAPPAAIIAVEAPSSAPVHSGVGLVEAGAVPQPARRRGQLAHLWSRVRRQREPLIGAGARPEFVEPFRLLALTLTGLADHERVRRVLIMGAFPRDGRTLTVANLGIALASMGRRVALLETDLRHPALASLLSVDPSPAVHSLTAPVPATPGLSIASAEALAGALRDPPTLRATMDSLLETADFVLLDSPPCAMSADAFALAWCVDGVLYVVRRRHQDIPAQRRVRAQLQRFGARVLGVVYNEG